MADRLARLEDVTARHPGRALQPGFRISRVLAPFRQQLVATPIISPAKAATSTTRSSARTQAGAGGGQATGATTGRPRGYLLRVETVAASVTKRVTLE